LQIGANDDDERTRFLESSGLKVIRFKNEDIEARLDWVIEKINNALIESPPSQPSPRAGGGRSRR
jgi:very-short-patch-repair endonuclease